MVMQYRQKVNVQAGLLNDKSIVPFFINDDLTAFKNDDLSRMEQNGAPSHYGRNVGAYSDSVFAQMLIARTCEKECLLYRLI